MQLTIALSMCHSVHVRMSQLGQKQISGLLTQYEIKSTTQKIQNPSGQ